MKRNSSVFRLATAALAVAALGWASPLNAVPAQTNSPKTPPAAPAQASVLPYGVNHVVKMYQQGVNQDAIINFIKDTDVPYSFSAEQILYLHNLGVPPDIINALIQRGAQLQREHQVPPPVVLVNTSTDYPYYTYAYPYDDYFFDYGYPYYYGGPVFIGGGWGWGYGGYHGGYHGRGFHGGGRGGGHR